MGIAVGAASGFLGAFLILKRMALVGDAMTHVALPGIGLAFLFGINPFLGAFVLLFVAMVLVWKLEQRTDLPVETLVGIFFATSLAAGILLTPQLELYEALFGDISRVGIWDGIFAVAAAIGVFAIMIKIAEKMLMGIISEDLAVSSGIKVRKLNFIFLLLVAIVVALGVKVVGTMLMGGLVVIPAAAAKNISRSFRQYAFWSSLLGFVCAGVGIFVGKNIFNFAGTRGSAFKYAFFLITLAFKRR